MLKPYMQSPLHHFDLPSKARKQDNSSGIWANEMPLLGYLTIRGDGSKSVFVEAVGKVTGLALPVKPCSFSQGENGTLLWVSPDEWILVCSRANVVPFIKALESVLSNEFFQVVDNSGGLSQIYLSGKDHVTVLRHMGVYDFETIVPGKVVGTVCGKASLNIYRTNEHGLYIVFRRSFADYFWRLLEKAARPYGFGVSLLNVGKNAQLS